MAMGRVSQKNHIHVLAMGFVPLPLRLVLDGIGSSKSLGYYSCYLVDGVDPS